MIEDDLPPDFRERFAAWLRIEPRCRQNDFGPGVQARTGDALWLLTRQWQTGEFQGEDAGSPVNVALSYSTETVDRLKLGDEPSGDMPADVPLETIVEQELPAVPGLAETEFEAINYRERVRVGQEFERRLRGALDASGSASDFETLIAALRSEHGFPVSRPPMPQLDRATQRFVSFMEGRVIDGSVLLTQSIAAPAASPLSDAELEALRVEVIGWYGAVCSRPDARTPAGWRPRSMDYQFEANTYPDAAAPDAVPPEEQKTRLVAPDYRNGTVDWFTFSAGSQQSENWDNTSTGVGPIVTTPTRIQVTGTALRWWEFEDGQTDFGAMDVAKPDLPKLLLMEFVLIYGDDWFSLPAPVGLGNLARVDGLTVRNVFGEITTVLPAREIGGSPVERFDLFSIAPAEDASAPGIGTDDDDERPLLFIPPMAGFRQESVPLDEVHFLRDEGANMIFGVEHVVPNGIGRPVDGHDAHRERLHRADEIERAGLQAITARAVQRLADDTLAEDERVQLTRLSRLARARMEELRPNATPTPSQSSEFRYRFATTVPENWIPFIPMPRNVTPPGQPHAGFDFLRARMIRNTDHVRLDELLTEAFVQTTAGELGIDPESLRWMWDESDPDSIPAMSRLLALDEDALLRFEEETVPRAGLRVQLTKQRARWVDGGTHVWLGRKVLTGRGEGSSGLRFDTITPERE